MCFGCGSRRRLRPRRGRRPGASRASLQQIYDKLDECTGVAPCGVPKTGQTECWDAAGSPVPCADTGQDGEYQAGVSVAPRFTDNGDGTVQDNLTGLVWLKDANCLGGPPWTDALSTANALSAATAPAACGLTDGSMPGDWRLPNLRELHSLVDYGHYEPALPSGHPFLNVLPAGYFTSTTDKRNPDVAWKINLADGVVYDTVDKSMPGVVWTVRGRP